MIAIAHKALQTATSKATVPDVPRHRDKTLEASLKTINEWYIGWSNYYSLTHSTIKQRVRGFYYDFYLILPKSTINANIALKNS